MIKLDVAYETPEFAVGWTRDRIIHEVPRETALPVGPCYGTA